MAEHLINVGPNKLGDNQLWVGQFLKDVHFFYSEQSSDLILTDTDAINNMLDNLFMTQRGERHFEPTFGCNIPALLFEPCDQQTAYLIETEIFGVVQEWMPYIGVNYAQTSVRAYPDDYAFDIRLAWWHKIAGLKGNFSLKIVK